MHCFANSFVWRLIMGPQHQLGSGFLPFVAGILASLPFSALEEPLQLITSIEGQYSVFLLPPLSIHVLMMCIALIYVCFEFRLFV